MHARIYDNPKGKWFRAGQYPPLSVSGQFDEYISGEAYEGRLQIDNAVGDCAVRLTSSTNLPPGYELTVDNDTSEVVLRWPAYEAVSLFESSVVNPGFESGDSDWAKGLGFRIGSYTWDYGDGEEVQAFAGTKSAEYAKGHRGNSRVMSAQPRICDPATVVTGTCQIQQGPSRENNTGGWVLLQFLDTDGVMISEHAGTAVNESDNGEWHQSSVTATAPTGTVYALLGAECYRKKENKPMWVDTFAWNLDPAVDEYVGTNDTLDVLLCLEVTDAAGRSAPWCGTITAASWITTLLHFNGADASTTFTDESGKIWTAFADSQIDTGQSQFGGASGLFDGTGDYLSTPHSADLDFGTDDFTVECWVRLTAVGAQLDLMTTWGSAATGWSFVILANGHLSFFCAGNGVDLQGSIAISAGAWVHVAAARRGNQLRLFVGGVHDGTLTNTTNIASSAQATIAAFFFSGAPINRFAGHIDELRVTKGYARYTANFTPPIAEFDYP